MIYISHTRFSGPAQTIPIFHRNYLIDNILHRSVLMPTRLVTFISLLFLVAQLLASSQQTEDYSFHLFFCKPSPSSLSLSVLSSPLCFLISLSLSLLSISASFWMHRRFLVYPPTKKTHKKWNKKMEKPFSIVWQQGPSSFLCSQLPASGCFVLLFT